jgi:hypothetical protein
MSLSQRAVIDRPEEDTPSKHHYGFILVLICIALSLAVLSAFLTPVSVGNVSGGDVSYVGP